MKSILLASVILSGVALTAFFVPEMTVTTLALGGLGTGSAVNGVFYPNADRTANLRFEFKLAQNVLFNRAGSSEITFLNPFTGKDVTIEVSKGEPYPADAKDYLQRLEPIASKLEIPKGAKAGVYSVKFIAEMFLCEAVLKVCYREETPGSFELRVAQTGPDTPVRLEYARPQR